MGTESIGAVEGFGGKTIDIYDADYDNSEMDQEGFLEVLLTSFKYQDPFETEDISKFIDNTVKLRELEIMKNFEDSVASLHNNNTLFLNATNLIDKDVVYKGDKIYIEEGRGYVEFVPMEDAKEAELYIYDDDGKLVAQKSFTDLKAGQKYSFTLEDETVADGFYTVNVAAASQSDSVNVEIYPQAKVEGIEKDSSDILAVIGGEKFKVEDIVKIGGQI